MLLFLFRDFICIFPAQGRVNKHKKQPVIILTSPRKPLSLFPSAQLALLFLLCAPIAPFWITWQTLWNENQNWQHPAKNKLSRYILFFWSQNSFWIMSANITIFNTNRNFSDQHLFRWDLKSILTFKYSWYVIFFCVPAVIRVSLHG